MIDKKELLEARAELIKSIDMIDDSLKILSSAKTWGIFDILGGGFFTSLMKRDKIGKVNDNIRNLRYQLEITQKELGDVDQMIDIEIPNNFTDNFFDIAFDNIFTDILTQSKLNKTNTKLTDLRNYLSRVLDKIDIEIDKY